MAEGGSGMTEGGYEFLNIFMSIFIAIVRKVG